MRHHAARTGSLVGAVFGLVFVLVNAPSLPAATVWTVLGVVAFVAVVVLAARSTVEAPEPSRGALRVYGVCVVGEVLAIVVGARLLTATDHADLVLPWVVVVVGVHFGPFARAFGVPVFTWLAVALVVTGLAAAAGVLSGWAEADRAGAVVAGFVLMAGSAAGLRDRVRV